MTEVTQHQSRYRINTSITTKGVITWDATVELVDASIEDVLAESDRLVAELKRRYPLDTAPSP